MPDYLTMIGFDLVCAPHEAERLIAAFALTGSEPHLPTCLTDAFPSNDPDDPFAAFAALFEGPDAFCLDADIHRIEVGVRIVGVQSPALAVIAELIRRLAPSSLPTGFTWANTCVWPGMESFGGGYALITADGCELVEAAEDLFQRLKTFEDSVPGDAP